MKTPVDSLPIFALGIHADFQCRHSGACCTAGWTIPIEDDEHRRVCEGIASGRLTIPGAPKMASECSAAQPGTAVPARDATRATGAFLYTQDLRAGAAAIIRTTAQGACVFLDREAGTLCAIQRDLGHDDLPASCRQFPRVALSDSRGTFVSLSHYCPTAALLLFRDDATLGPVLNPPMCAGRTLEGFDAAQIYPPLLRPNVLFDLAAYDIWERFVVRTCARQDLTPECVLALVAATAERIRSWTAIQGPLQEFVQQATEPERDVQNDVIVDLDAFERLYRQIAATIPHGLPRPVLPDELATTDARLVRPAWSEFAKPVRRYLAARAFGSWITYQGDGLRTMAHSLVGAIAVLRVEAIRQAARVGRVLDAGLLLEAFRAADMLLVHLASRERMALRFSEIEHAPAPDLPGLALRHP